MFGLMLKNSCGLHEEAREHYRLHHCGTCKAIGNQYHQSARLFLNFDCVFLAELLTALSDEDTGSWQDSYHSYNCFATGGEGVELPIPLRYAASTNVLLTLLKTDDNLKDAPSFLWRLVKRWFHPDFEKAETEMIRFGIDMDQIWHWIGVQQQREKENHRKGLETLDYLAEPTARITAAIFAQGTILTHSSEAPMYEFGFHLGRLIYILDALEDIDQDRRKNQFNALQQSWSTVDEAVRQTVADFLFSLSRQLQETIQQLSLAPALQEEYGQRLSANLSVRVANALEGKKAHFENLKQTLWARIAMRVQNARAFARQVAQQKHPWVAAPQYALCFLAVFVVPETTKEIHTVPGQGIAIAAVLTGMLAALFSRRKIRRFWSIYKKELKRRYKRLKGKPDWFECWRTVGIILLLLGGGALLILLVYLVSWCLNCDEDGTSDCVGDICEGCCQMCCDVCCQAIC